MKPVAGAVKAQRGAAFQGGVLRCSAPERLPGYPAMAQPPASLPSELRAQPSGRAAERPRYPKAFAGAQRGDLGRPASV